MGFYGNITNTSRTTFQFDKIYPNRLAMDTMCATDEIYNGRYVLVEYDNDLEDTAYRRGWYLVQTENHNYLYQSPPSVEGEDRSDNINYYNLNSLSSATKINKTDLENNPSMIYLESGHVFNNVNDKVRLVEFKNNEIIAEYDIDNDEEFTAWQGLLRNFSPNEFPFLKAQIEASQNFTSYGAYYINIVNEDIYPLDDISGATYIDPERGLAGIVKKGGQYNYNIIAQMWQRTNTTYIQDGIEYYDFAIPEEDIDSYTRNFNIDRNYYNSSRGFDSTVWQKVFVNGVEQYVMIAELNTVVPTFGVAGEAPSLLPLNPHWSSNSTNVYYELHWQPSWGFRIKAANPALSTPVIDSATGTLLRDGGKSWLRLNDDIKYPSDVKVKWNYTFENNGLPGANSKQMVYYDPVQQTWVTNQNVSVPAAIYYNKDGFESDRVVYSKDLISAANYPNWTNENYISLSPTGLSGNLYSRHDGIYGKIPQIDTQEFSLMLPAIGDMLASVWDLIYGGRETNNAIKQTNRRNKDIKWENGPEYLERKGLRLFYNKNGVDPLTGDDVIKAYDKRAVETLAGCINTAHDLFGMLIKEIPEEVQMASDASFQRASLENVNESLSDFIPDINDNRIYFLEAEKKYYRKVNTYWFTDIEDKFYNYLPVENNGQLTSEIIHDGSYYVWDDQKNDYVQIEPEDEYDPNKEYYYKTVGDVYTEVEGAFFDFPYQANEKRYEYYRIPARQIGLSDIYIKVTPLMNIANINEFYEYSEEDETYIRYTGNTLNADIEAGKIYILNKDNPTLYHYLKVEDDIGKKEYYALDVSENDRVVLNDIYEPKKYFYIEEDHKSMQPEVEFTFVREDGQDPDPTKQYYTIDSSLTNDRNKLGSSGFNKVHFYIPGKYYFLAKRNLGNTYVEDGYYVDNSEDGSNIYEHGEIEYVGTAPKIRCYAAKDIKHQINPNGENITYIKEIKYYQIIPQATPLKYSQDDVNNWKSSHPGEECPFNTSTDKRFSEEDYNNYQILHNGIKPPWQIGDLVYNINYETQVVIQGFNDSENPVYKPFVYYLLNSAQNTYYISEDSSYDNSKTYYLRTESYQLNNKTTYSIEDVLDLQTEIYYGQLFFYQNNTYFNIESRDVDTGNPTKYRFLSKKRLEAMYQEGSLDTNQIYTLGEKDLKFVDLITFLNPEVETTNIIPYGDSPIIEKVAVFYQPNVYHYKDSGDNYILSSDPYDANRIYYKLRQESISKAPDGIIYKKSNQQDPYYYESNDEYVEVNLSNIEGDIEHNTNNIRIDQNTRINDVKIYEKAEVYVKEDTSGKLPKGMKWNVNSLCIPDSITLGTRSSKDQLEELLNYGTEESTINGIILQTLATLSPNDVYVRDLDTVAGGLNSMKDILATIGEIRSRDLTIIDDAGRIHSAPIITWQNPNMITVGGTHTNDQIIEKRWLAATIDGNISNPLIYLSHLYNPITNTTESINMNDDPQTSGNESLNSVLINEAIKDETGHVVGFNKKTITFPNNFGTIVVGSNTIKADSPHASLTISSDGHEELIAPVIDNNTLKLYHNPPSTANIKAGNNRIGDASLPTVSHGTGNLTPSFGGTFIIPYIEADSCGHLTALKQDTIQIPALNAITINKSQVNGLEEDLSSIESSYNSLSREVDTINVAIGNNTIYTPDNLDTPENELKRVTIQQLTSRVAQLEEVIRRLISIDENTNSMVVLSNDEIDEILDWDRITIDNSNITVTFDHGDNQEDESIDDYLISDWVRRAQFGSYTGNGTPKYYALNSTLQTPAYEEITLPFALTRNFIETYGELSINETEGEVRILERTTPPIYSAP